MESNRRYWEAALIIIYEKKKEKLRSKMIILNVYIVTYK